MAKKIDGSLTPGLSMAVILLASRVLADGAVSEKQV